jgi:hypothetical protein
VFTLYNAGSGTFAIYYFEIWNYDYSQKLATMKQNKNLYGVGHFDVQKILASNVEPQRGLEATSQLATSPDEVLEYNVKGGYISTSDTPIITFESATTYKVTMGRKPFNELDWDETPYISDWNFAGSGLHTINDPCDWMTDWNYDTTKSALTGVYPSEYNNAAYD